MSYLASAIGGARPDTLATLGHLPVRRPDTLDDGGNRSPRGFAYERAIIDFIRLWHRFGGGSARDIFEKFGLSEHEFFTKTVELLGSTGAAGVSEETANRIRKVCRWRLSVRSHPTA
jgi:hypothetical protein